MAISSRSRGAGARTASASARLDLAARRLGETLGRLGERPRSPTSSRRRRCAASRRSPRRRVGDRARGRPRPRRARSSGCPPSARMPAAAACRAGPGEDLSARISSPISCRRGWSPRRRRAVRRQCPTAWRMPASRRGARSARQSIATHAAPQSIWSIWRTNGKRRGAAPPPGLSVGHVASVSVTASPGSLGRPHRIAVSRTTDSGCGRRSRGFVQRDALAHALRERGLLVHQPVKSPRRRGQQARRRPRRGRSRCACRSRRSASSPKNSPACRVPDAVWPPFCRRR